MYKSVNGRRNYARKPIPRVRRDLLGPKKSPGRATIELVFLPSQQARVTVTRWCDKPLMIETVNTMLGSIQRAPKVIVMPFDPDELLRKHRRGGPLAPPDEEKLRIVRGWLRVQGRMNQEVYADEHGISPSTLRRWMRQLEQQGKL